MKHLMLVASLVLGPSLLADPAAAYSCLSAQDQASENYQLGVKLIKLGVEIWDDEARGPYCERALEARDKFNSAAHRFSRGLEFLDVAKDRCSGEQLRAVRHNIRVYKDNRTLSLKNKGTAEEAVAEHCE